MVRMGSNVSVALGCLFVHIPKTGGTSVEFALGLYAPDDPDMSQDHRSAAEFRDSMSDAEFDALFKFTFVRNPWARLYSWYRNVLRDSEHRLEHGISSVDYPFSEFVVNFAGSGYMRPQRWWINDSEGKSLVDFVGRYENLVSDFELVRPNIGDSSFDHRLPHLVPGDGSRYVDSYTPELIEFVRDCYVDDVRFFGYTYGDDC